MTVTSVEFFFGFRRSTPKRSLDHEALNNDNPEKNSPRADHVLRMPGDVAGAVSDAFKRCQDEEKAGAGAHELGIVLHLFLEERDAALVEFVDFVVAIDHLTGKRRVAFGIGAHRVEQHRMGNAGDTIDFNLLRAEGLIGKLDRVLRDIDRIVADPFEIGCDFEHGCDLAQFVGDGLLTPNQLDAVRFDAPAEVVDRVVTSDHAGARGRIAAIEGFNGDPNRVAA